MERRKKYSRLEVEESYEGEEEEEEDDEEEVGFSEMSIEKHKKEKEMKKVGDCEDEEDEDEDEDEVVETVVVRKEMDPEVEVEKEKEKEDVKVVFDVVTTPKKKKKKKRRRRRRKRGKGGKNVVEGNEGDKVVVELMNGNKLRILKNIKGKNVVTVMIPFENRIQSIVVKTGNGKSKELVVVPKEKYEKLMEKKDPKMKKDLDHGVEVGVFNNEFPGLYKFVQQQVFQKPKVGFEYALFNKLTYLNNAIKKDGKEFSDDSVYWFNEKYIVLYDPFPRARIHLLILSRDLQIQRIDDLTVSILQEMDEVRKNLVGHLKKNLDPKFDVVYGFHAISPLKCVHMHVYSNDFDGTHLRNKRDWNMFSSKEFLLSPAFLITMLKERGKIAIDKEKFREMKGYTAECPNCHEYQTNMIQNMKKHYLKCKFE